MSDTDDDEQSRRLDRDGCSAARDDCAQLDEHVASVEPNKIAGSASAGDRAPVPRDRDVEIAARLAGLSSIRTAVESLGRHHWTMQSAQLRALQSATEVVRKQQLVESAQLQSVIEAVARQQRIFGSAQSSTVQAAVLAVARQQRFVEQFARSPVQRVMTQIVASVRSFQLHNTSQVLLAVRTAQGIVGAVSSWVSSTAAAAGKFVTDVYRAAAPPNWDTDDPDLSYNAAVRLAFEEGVPLAWSPDPDTVKALLAIPRGQDDRKALVRGVLAARQEKILDHCEMRMVELMESSATSAEQKRMADIALQSIGALRAGLVAPAQSAAANLVDQLLRRIELPSNGRYTYGATAKRVRRLAAHIDTVSWLFLVGLREITTMMPVLTALTEWWPGRGELPCTFSRHATAHAIAEPNQVNATNALIAVMLAVSLLCQEAASNWVALRTFVEGGHVQG